MTIPQADPPACSFCGLGIFSGAIKVDDKYFCSDSHIQKYNTVMGIGDEMGNQNDSKPTNPKDAIGSTTKVPMSAVPIPVLMEVGLAMLEGGAKYGRHNFRAVGVRASVYFDATCRHLFDYWEGEDFDPDSAAGLHHVVKAISTLCVLRDAMIQGNLEDDRPPRSPKQWMAEMNNKVPLILEQHADKTPKHYTIEDEV